MIDYQPTIFAGPTYGSASTWTMQNIDQNGYTDTSTYHNYSPSDYSCRIVVLDPDPESDEWKLVVKRWLSQVALLDGLRRLQKMDDDPSPKIPIQARDSRRQPRPLFKKRVCAGSSRYRVLMGKAT